MSGTFTDIYDLIVTTLADAGLPVLDDSRAVRPPCIIVEPPTAVQVPNASTVTLEYPVIICAPPPGNRDSAIYLMNMADRVIDLLEGSFEARPTVYNAGTQELPAYQVTIRLTAIRSN